MCLKQISSLFTTKSHKESLSPTFLFLALVATPSPEDDVILCVFLRVFSLIIIHNKELFLRKIFEFSLHKTNFLVAHKPAETKKKTRLLVKMHQIFFPPKSLLIKSRYKRNLLRANNKLSPFATNASSLFLELFKTTTIYGREESEER
jgi:hypothetical protein